MKKVCQNQSGFSLIEVLVVTTVMALFFGGLITVFMHGTNLLNQSKATQSALSLANDRMEYFRSLPYDDVGTLLGIPAGIIPQNSTTTFNGIDFYERVLVEYVDDPADGQDTATTTDSNGIPSDYKRLKIEYTWNLGSATSSISLISNIVPRSVESTAGGGTVRVNVMDDTSSLLPGASVRLANDSIVPPVDVTRFSDASGIALFSGAPTGSDYTISVTGPIGGNDYSTDQTYLATTSNPIPVVAPFSVLEADVSTLTFQIGELSDMNVTTYSTMTDGSEVEDFSDLLGVASSSNIDASGQLVLADTLGVYESSGVAYLATTTPVTITDWHSVRVAATSPAGSDYKVRFYTGSAPGPYTLIPEGDLPGNTTGFTASIIDISSLDVLTYSSIVVGIELTTTDTSVTPEIDEIGVYYIENRTPFAGVGIDIVGTKVIGEELGGEPIYKYDSSFTTDGSGETSLVDMEFDVYSMTPQGAYDIATACDEHPVTHLAGVESDVELLLVANAASTLRVVVVDNWGERIPGASVNLSRTGYDVTLETNTCGQAFFTGGVTDNADYRLTVGATGYTTNVDDPLTVDGDTVIEVTLF